MPITKQVSFEKRIQVEILSIVSRVRQLEYYRYQKMGWIIAGRGMQKPAQMLTGKDLRGPE